MRQFGKKETCALVSKRCDLDKLLEIEITGWALRIDNVDGCIQ